MAAPTKLSNSYIRDYGDTAIQVKQLIDSDGNVMLGGQVSGISLATTGMTNDELATILAEVRTALIDSGITSSST